jgi:hypothetical protein
MQEHTIGSGCYKARGHVKGTSDTAFFIAQPPELWRTRMSEISKVFYARESGDEWSLVIDTETRLTNVRHTPNRASGAQFSMTRPKSFLATEKESR